ncbi:hypothetical protein [Lysobacter sp. HA35]
MSPSAREPRAPRSTIAEQREPSSASTPPARLDDVASATDTYDTLRERYGDAAIAHETLHGAEGAEAPGWVLFPKDATRRIEVHLDEKAEHPSALYVRKPSVWTRADGVRTGITTVELERLNGRPFEFAGFGWDYGGVVTDWKGGKLSNDGRFVGPVTLCEPSDSPDDYPIGDADFMSDLPIVRKLPPTVCEVGIDLSRPTTN